ncbi:hypothetical protein UFOVP978_17 [uncultured Caudovirales phage]|uniref:Uncharacterized protein n=1 Tax=uncultured Caudovirales phage TaxID=2100421 RepID=A0A6J5Q3Z4_9CAUD|nr:hypothetical protein UFOVP978_17 [uncultured Caudovirales phage]
MNKERVRRLLSKSLLSKGGDKSGHSFHGNQWTGGIGGGPKPPPRPKYMKPGLIKPPAPAAEAKPKTEAKTPAKESAPAAKKKGKGLVGELSPEGSKRWKDGRPVETKTNAARQKKVNAKLKVKQRAGVFDEGDVVTPENATEPQKTEARRLANAIAAGIATEVHTSAASLVVSELATMIQKEKAKKDKDASYIIKDINLCTMTVSGTNAFCAGNMGINRVQMPQFSAQFREGSPAAEYAKEHGSYQDPHAPEGNLSVDVSKAFIADLEKQGIKVDVGVSRNVSTMRATQNELNGSSVVGIMGGILDGRKPDATPEQKAEMEKIMSSPVFMTEDGFILDGHHRFAAVLAADYKEDGKAGDLSMNVIMIHSTIDKILPYSIIWADNFGMTKLSASNKPGEAGQPPAKSRPKKRKQ